MFVNVKVGFFGLCLGYSHTRSIMLAMSDQLLKELEGGGHSIVGADHTFAMGQDSETKANVITTPAGSADLVVSALVSGAMMDFSLAGELKSRNGTRKRPESARPLPLGRVRAELPSGLPEPNLKRQRLHCVCSCIYESP